MVRKSNFFVTNVRKQPIFKWPVAILFLIVAYILVVLFFQIIPKIRFLAITQVTDLSEKPEASYHLGIRNLPSEPRHNA